MLMAPKMTMARLDVYQPRVRVRGLGKSPYGLKVDRKMPSFDHPIFLFCMLEVNEFVTSTF